MRGRHGIYGVVMLLSVVWPASANTCDVTSIEDCAVIRLVNETGELVNRTFIQGNPGPGLRPGGWEDVILQPEPGWIAVDWFHDHEGVTVDMDQYHGGVKGVDACVTMVVRLLPGGALTTGDMIPKACRRDRLQKEAEAQAQAQAQAQREADQNARLAKDAADRARLQSEATAKAQQERAAAARQQTATPTSTTQDPAELARQRTADAAAARERALRAQQEEAARLQREAVKREQERQAAEAAKIQSDIDRRNKFNQDMLAGEADRNAQYAAEAESTMNAAERRDRLQAAVSNAKARSTWKAPTTSGGSAAPLDLSDLRQAPTVTPTPNDRGLPRPGSEPTPTPRP
jgi:hypothetical protein